MTYIIDDDKSVRRACELLLKSRGMEFMSFESATQFVANVNPETRDNLVLDLNLPVMSGCDLLKKFTRDGVHVGVIVVTAFDDPESRMVCNRYGVKAFLKKPVDGEMLINLLKRV